MKSDSERQTSYAITYMWNLKYIYIHKLTYLKNRNRLTDFEKLTVTKGDTSGGWRDGLGAWDWHIYTEVYEMIGQLGPVV